MSLLQIFCLKLLKHRNQIYVQFYIDFPIYSVLYNVPNKFEGGTKYGTKRMGKVKKGKCGDL